MAIRSVGSRLGAAGHVVDYAFLEDFAWLGKLGRFAQFSFGIAILGRICRGGYDVALLHSADGFWYGWLKRLAPRLATTRSVMVSHGLEHRFWERFVEEERRGRLRISTQHRFYMTRIRLPQVASSIRTADILFTLTAHERDYVVGRGWKDKERIRVIPNGVDPVAFAGDRDRIIQPRLLFVGSWQWRKGVAYLADAFGVIGERYPHARLTMVGPHEREEELRQRFPAVVRDRVFSIQPVPPAEMAAIYRIHDIYVFPSLFEGDPLTIREAMAAAMPIVTTDMFPMKEIVEDGTTALLVAPADPQGIADAVCRLLGDPIFARRLGAAASRKAATRTWDDVALEVAAALK